MTAAATDITDACYCALARYTSRVLTDLYERELSPFGITLPQFSLLRVASREEPVGISALSDKLKLDRTTLARNLKLLEKAKLVAFDSNPEDQRERLVVLTPEGRKILAKASVAWEAAQSKVKHGVSKQKLDTLRQLARELAALDR